MTGNHKRHLQNKLDVFRAVNEWEAKPENKGIPADPRWIAERLKMDLERVKFLLRAIQDGGSLQPEPIRTGGHL